MFHCLGGVHHIVFCSVGLIDVLVENDETHYILIFGMSATVDVQHLREQVHNKFAILTGGELVLFAALYIYTACFLCFF